MKRTLLAAMLLFLPVASSWAAQEATPELKLLQENFNFGEVYQGATVQHTFLFENVGEAPLLIDKVRTSCGCTAALLSDEEIAPGQRGQLQVSFDSARFRGPVTKTIYLYSNDPLRRVAQMYIRGRVQPEIEQVPRRLDFGALAPEREEVSIIELTNHGEEEIRLSSVQVTAPELQVELSTPVLAPGDTGKLEVRVLPRRGTARINGYILISTSSVNVPELRIPVYGTVTE